MDRKIESIVAAKVSSDTKAESSLDRSDEIVKEPVDSSLKFGNDIDRLDLHEKVTSHVQEEEYEEVRSPFVNALIELSNDSNNSLVLTKCSVQNKDAPAFWVSLNLRCLIECLLLFSEMKFTKVQDLMEVCNAFTLLSKSKDYKELPSSYPYENKILRLREKLKQACVKAQHSEKIKFQLKKEDKINMIFMRFELSQFVPKQKFNQLDLLNK